MRRTGLVREKPVYLVQETGLPSAKMASPPSPLRLLATALLVLVLSLQSGELLLLFVVADYAVINLPID